MRRLGSATTSSFLLLALACTPSTFGNADGSGDSPDPDTDTGDGDGDGDPGDGDGAPGDGDGTPGDGDGAPGDGDGDACTTLGCDCDGSPGSCDQTLACVDGSCQVVSCGNGALDQGEVCDDGNQITGDGCDADCTLTEVLQITAGGRHTCALLEGGRIRCWGEGLFGALGLGNDDKIGDDETPAESVDTEFPLEAVAIEAGDQFVCASFEDLTIRCWGTGNLGQLGNAQTITIGDTETVADLAGIPLGGSIASFWSGGAHVCALMADDGIRCWGGNANGQLALGNNQPLGDNELPNTVDPIDIPASIAVAAGGDHSCAIDNNFDIYCWGRGGDGQLGYESNQNIGDGGGETPTAQGPVAAYSAMLPNGSTLTAASLGKSHTCVLFSSGEVVCWGKNDKGQLGQGNTTKYGDSNGESPDLLPFISLGADATAISAGFDHTCALLDGGAVRCWGDNADFQLGLGLGAQNPDRVGNDELPTEYDPVALGGPAVAIAAGSFHTCALLDSNEIYCWGNNSDGRLGYGDTNAVGDDETPQARGPVPLF